METSWVLPSTIPAPLDVSLHVVGTGGGIFIDGADHGLVVVGEKRYERPDLAHWPLGSSGVEGALRGSVSAFIRTVADGAPPLMSLTEARAAQQIAEAVIASIQSGRTVTL